MVKASVLAWPCKHCHVLPQPPFCPRLCWQGCVHPYIHPSTRIQTLPDTAVRAQDVLSTSSNRTLPKLQPPRRRQSISSTDTAPLCLVAVSRAVQGSSRCTAAWAPKIIPIQPQCHEPGSRDAQTRPLLSPSIPGGCSLHPTAQPHAGRQSPGCSLHHPILLTTPRCPRPGRAALLKGSGGGVLPGWSCPPRLPPPPHRRAGHPAQGAPALPLFSSCPRVSRGWRSWAQRFGELFSFQRLFFLLLLFFFPPPP